MVERRNKKICKINSNLLFLIFYFGFSIFISNSSKDFSHISFHNTERIYSHKHHTHTHTHEYVQVNAREYKNLRSIFFKDLGKKIKSTDFIFYSFHLRIYTYMLRTHSYIYLTNYICTYIQIDLLCTMYNTYFYMRMGVQS